MTPCAGFDIVATLATVATKEKQLDPDDFYENGHRYFLPHLSIDCAVFGFHEGELKVLLLQWRDSDEWCLPGGFIHHQEPVEAAAVRIVRERTGLENIFLTQFYTFGDPSRQRKNKKSRYLPAIKSDSWILQRFVTIGYWALVEYSRVTPVPDQFSSSCAWTAVDRIPPLILDHREILDKAMQSLRLSLNDYPVGMDLLPDKFTMPELQKLYETLLDRKLDRRNFQKRMLALDILQRLNEKKEGGAHKAPFLYRFDKRKYLRARKQGLRLGIS